MRSPEVFEASARLLLTFNELNVAGVVGLGTMAIFSIFLDIQSFKLIALAGSHDFSKMSLLLIGERAATALARDGFCLDEVFVDLVIKPGVLVSKFGDPLVMRYPVLFRSMASGRSVLDHILARPRHVRRLRGQVLKMARLVRLVTRLNGGEVGSALSLYP